MASLISWLVSNLSGAKSESESKEKINKEEKKGEAKPLPKPEGSKSKSTEVRKKQKNQQIKVSHKPNTDTVKEEDQIVSAIVFTDNHFEPAAPVHTKSPSKKVKRKKSIGSSFVKLEKPESEFETRLTSPLDNIGFSFFPVETKGKQQLEESFVKVSPISPKKNKTLKTNQTSQTFEEPDKAKTSAKPKIDDLPKSTIIQHYQATEQRRETKQSVDIKRVVQYKDDVNAKRQEKKSSSQHKLKPGKGDKTTAKKTEVVSDKRKQNSLQHPSQSQNSSELVQEIYTTQYSQSTSTNRILEYDDVAVIPKLNKGSFSAVLTGRSVIDDENHTILDTAQALGVNDKTSLESKFEPELVEDTSQILREQLTDIVVENESSVQSIAVASEIIQELFERTAKAESFGTLQNEYEQKPFEATEIAQSVAVESEIRQELSEYTAEPDSFLPNLVDNQVEQEQEDNAVKESLEVSEFQKGTSQILVENLPNFEIENRVAGQSVAVESVTRQEFSEYTAKTKTFDTLVEDPNLVENQSEEELLEEPFDVPGIQIDTLQILPEKFDTFENDPDSTTQIISNSTENQSEPIEVTNDIPQTFLEKPTNEAENTSDTQSVLEELEIGQGLLEHATTEFLEADTSEEESELTEQNVLEQALEEIITSNKTTEQVLQELQREITNLIEYTEAIDDSSVHATNNNYLEVYEREAENSVASLSETIQDSTKIQQELSAILDTLNQPFTVPETSESLQEHSSETETVPTTTEHLNMPTVFEQEITQITEKQDFKKTKADMISEVRVLTLNDQEHKDATLYRLEKKWILQFRLGPTLLGRKIFLFCNYPQDNPAFERDHYYQLNWVQDEGCKHADDTALSAQIVIEIAGSFHYYFTYENINSEPQGAGFFLVDPVLKYGNDENLPLDCIQCQTVLAKNLGPFSTWENKLRVAKESGYNMIHFTPIQELGASNSGYSLSHQLKLNPIFTEDKGRQTTFHDVENFIVKMRKEWKVTSICDIVLNHTANESEWLEVHPEVTYNCSNCKYLRPAYLLDAALYQFSNDVRKGFYEDKGIPVEVCTEDHINAIRHALHTYVLPVINIPELYTCDVNKLVASFLNSARNMPPSKLKVTDQTVELKLIQDAEFKRLTTIVDMELALKLYNSYRLDSFDEETRLRRCAEEFKNKLDLLNKTVTDKVNENLNAAIENCIAGIRYFRVQLDGPRIKEVTVKDPLTSRYFTDFGNPLTVKEHEELMYSENGKFLMAHNGWVMDADPLKNFAAPGSDVYIRRELIAWGDSVKLRYGEKPEDCPFLWNHMRQYVEQTANIFDGVRLDNCHSTPISVAEYLLDCARKVRPDLYVVAELFTNSDQKDNIFVNRLGITSLIREAMSAWDSHEEGRLVYRYGGYPVGSFQQPKLRPLVPTVAHALFLDLTHDNPSPVQKRSVFDMLPSAALVNMASCASGSNRGYDELVPHHIHVVDENRQYTEWTGDLSVKDSRYVSSNSGLISAKKALNDLHYYLGINSFDQVYVDQMDSDIVAVTRHNPKTHESVILVAFTAFSHPNIDAANYQRGIKSLRVEGVLDEIILEATLSHVNVKSGGSKYSAFENFKQSEEWINGLEEYYVDIQQHIDVSKSDVFEKADAGKPNVTQLNFKNFKPGSVVAIKISLPVDVQNAIKSLRNLATSIYQRDVELSNIIKKMTLTDLNRALYRCNQEEQDDGKGFDVYNIPNYGSLVYAGLQGFISLLADIRPNNDLGHPMCGNLRDGNWMIDYVWQRLKTDEGTKELGQWIEANTVYLKEIPRYLIPSYFDVVITGIYILLIEQCYNLMARFVSCGSTFVRGLALGSVQFGGVVKSAGLPELSPNLQPPKPPVKLNEEGKNVQACVTLSAGLPHFSVGYMRNWGRDTFIALRGLFILTGRYQDARYHILGYAACLRHGLIPNLLDGGLNPRFNCRDAVWWWLYCIKSYVEETPNGESILSDNVSRIFPTDDSPNEAPGVADQKLYDVIQEALNVHFQGLVFRERNAGRQIDAHMNDRGFNNQIGIHPETGFVFGGNESNCGTWMDKMGSSDRAGNRGKPATPRDGSAIELIGLSKSVVTWLHQLNQRKEYPYDGVERTQKNGSTIKWTFEQWAEKIHSNFEKYFWINTEPVPGELKPNLVNKRGIYKDCFGASQDWTDFQLRCNFPIAMVAAPELFEPMHAWTALNNAEKYLLGPLGMKTLDPDDWAYRGDYDNSNDSPDPTVAHGFNYHQGPEWVWPVGYYLRSRLHFAAANNELQKTISEVKTVLSRHFTELQTSSWRGLPELTNSNGSFCKDSSRTQAWSMSCILEVLYDLQKIESGQPIN